MPENRFRQLDFKAELAKRAELVNSTLAELVAGQTDIPDRLKRAIDFTLEAPGKRIRGAVVLWCCELVTGQLNRTARIAAAAVEMVHTYSLIHDDLPAMDDDDFRRGQASCHKAFDEGTAILTGDALLTLAFEVLAVEIDEPARAVELIKTLAVACGPAGMIAGQMADMENENSNAGMETLRYIHTNKTAKMFASAAAMGAICGRGNEGQIEHLRQYGLKIGLGFQVADDVIDVSGDSEHIGKTAGKDASQGKVTYPAIVGVVQAKSIAQDICRQAIAEIEVFDARADILRHLALALAERTR